MTPAKTLENSLARDIFVTQNGLGTGLATLSGRSIHGGFDHSGKRIPATEFQMSEVVNHVFRLLSWVLLRGSFPLRPAGEHPSKGWVKVWPAADVRLISKPRRFWEGGEFAEMTGEKENFGFSLSSCDPEIGSILCFGLKEFPAKGTEVRSKGWGVIRSIDADEMTVAWCGMDSDGLKLVPSVVADVLESNRPAKVATPVATVSNPPPGAVPTVDPRFASMLAQLLQMGIDPVAAAAAARASFATPIEAQPVAATQPAATQPAATVATVDPTQPDPCGTPQGVNKTAPKVKTSKVKTSAPPAIAETVKRLNVSLVTK